LVIDETGILYQLLRTLPCFVASANGADFRRHRFPEMSYHQKSPARALSHERPVSPNIKRNVAWSALIVVLILLWFAMSTNISEADRSSGRGAGQVTVSPTATPTPTATPACQPWAEVAAYPTTAFSLMATSLNGDVYGFGGRDANYIRLASAYRYDPNTNQWTQLASMPQICFWCSAVAVNGRIWVINGSHDQGGSNNSSVYDPALNSWSAGSNGLVSTYGQAALYLDGVLYRIGGIDPGGYSTTIEEYGVRMLAPMPLAVAWEQAAAIGGYIYVAGGSTSTGPTSKTYRYDPATDTWDDNAIADLPEPRAWAASGVVNGRWVIAGGQGTEGSAVEWDPQTNIWSSIAPPLFPRSDMGGAVAEGKLYVVGGLDISLNQVTDQTQRYDPSTCATPTPSASATATATATATSNAGATTSPTLTAGTTTGPTSTAVATSEPSATPAATASPTACSLQFIDVPPGSTFYAYIRCLACLGIINGYPDGTFKPNNQVTRGQLSKIVSNSAGFSDNQTTQMFQDVPMGSTFFQYIGRLASRGYINGYACGDPGEPCRPGNLPYFRPGNNTTRGQISKIVSNAAGFNDPPSGQQFQDVAAGSTFYTYTFRLATRDVMQGYQCGGHGEPCIPPDNLPYFRPNANATRGQTSKIVSNTFFPDCSP
jgi:N-acetylneuraminic acid mutarotase